MKCECIICKNYIPFVMPEGILEAAKSAELVLFCGAGISTESTTVLPFSFYSSIRNELNIQDDIAFSELMQRYCRLPDGRRKLLRKIKDRFEYIHSFPELEFYATRFHKELAELHLIKTIITTNWDTYFEEYCGATPIVIPEDFVFWDETERCVLKIHGSINNLSTIVATREDYAKCEEQLQKGIIGAKLKTILATKTVVFVGFSFGDEDFALIMNYLKEELKELFPHIYIVTLDENLSKKISYDNCTYIVTDGTFFLHQLKLNLFQKGLIVNLQAKPVVASMRNKVRDCHERTSLLDYELYPQVIYCLAYQDGVLHAFDRFFQLYHKGEYNTPGYVKSRARSYEQLVDECIQNKNYWDAAYYEGYLNGLVFIEGCSEDESIKEYFPCFYLPSAKRSLDSYEIFLDELRRVESETTEYKQYAVTLTRKSDSSIVLHHPPF